MTFFVKGIPKGQPRPRAFARKTSQGFVARVYDAGTAENWKSCVAEAAKPFLDQRLTDPIALRLTFYFPRPKAHYLKSGLRDNAPHYHASKPDADNAAKAVLDTLVRIGLIADDAQVAILEVRKLYAEPESGCGIEVYTLGLDTFE